MIREGSLSELLLYTSIFIPLGASAAIAALAVHPAPRIATGEKERSLVKNSKPSTSVEVVLQISPSR